jgi:hypothetical protein
MYRADTFPRPDQTERRRAPEDAALDYQGIELAPTTLDSLVTWDVSGHAQCEKNRLNSLGRGRRLGASQGGY